jgi:urease accessory protein
MAAVEADIGAGWRGALSLRFAQARERTVIARRRHEGPFCVQQPFYPGDGACHVYLLHPPGGLAAGDELLLDVDVEPGAAVLLTTPAATKFYKSAGAPSVQAQALRVAAGASLEWLPLETILFGGSRARITTEVFLEPGARFLGWETTVLGRPLSGDTYSAGTLEQRTHILVGGEPLLLERLRWRAGEPLLCAPWGLAGFGLCGTLYAYPADDVLLALARERLGAAAPSFESLPAGGLPRDRQPPADTRYGATLLGRLLVVRCLAREPEQLRTTLERLWAELRPAVVGLEAHPPRIWKT